MEDKDWAIISPYFKKAEFKCKCGKCSGYGKGIAKSLVITLNFLRKHYGKAINVNSGYRCPAHDKKVGGTGAGNHTRGLATDFWFSGLNKKDVLDFLKKTPYYRYAYSNETNMKYGIHIDTLPIDFGTNTIVKEVIKEIEADTCPIIELPIKYKMVFKADSNRIYKLKLKEAQEIFIKE